MRLLLVVPRLGMEPSGNVIPGGLENVGRCIARALASSPDITKLGVFSLSDECTAEPIITQMIQAYRHNDLELSVRAFDGGRTALTFSMAEVSLFRSYEYVMYVLINQAVLSLLPFHPPYAIWEIGIEVFQPLSFWKRHALNNAHTLLSISHNTTQVARRLNPTLKEAKVVHLAVEPPLMGLDSDGDQQAVAPYDPSQRKRAILIVGSMYRSMLYKGHRELIAAWPQVVKIFPDAELWIVGWGDGRVDIEEQAYSLEKQVQQRILFLGRLEDEELQDRFRTCRAFAMPSTGEGFGLVFVEAARQALPSIGGRHDSVKEIIVDNETGILVEQSPDDIARACISLLKDDELARRMGQAARQRYLDYFQFKHFRARLLDALGLRS
jgi:glycosyltransferase involved in cell wall biosynthesis